MWNQNHFVDRFAAYITAKGKDGKRYCRAVEVTGRLIEDGNAQKRLQHVLNTVARDGPSLCTPIQDGGIREKQNNLRSHSTPRYLTPTQYGCLPCHACRFLGY